jgi:4'-phosphopantetheinyl transferase
MSLSKPVARDAQHHGPVHWAWLPHVRGQLADPTARAWLARQLDLAPEALRLTRDTRGRPHLGAPSAGYDCSWSHSGDGLLVALAEGVRLGVDSERLHARPRALELAQRYFTAAEHDWLATFTAGPSRDRAFLRLWCAKEAVLKAHGHGLSFGLHRLRFEARDDRLRLVACDPPLGRVEDWSLHEFEPAADYVAALAWRPHP